MAWCGTKKAAKLRTMDKSKILVFDTETTGRSYFRDEIIQISILNGYGTVLFSSFIKPEHHKVWRAAEKINGINYDMVKFSPTFDDVLPQIQDIFDNAKLIVGYNVEFDIRFVRVAGVKINAQIFDVMSVFSSFREAVECSRYKKYKLSECAEYFNYFFCAHNSDEDARATLHCFNELIKDDRFIDPKLKQKIEQKRKDAYLQYENGSFNEAQEKVPKKKTMASVGIICCIISILILFLGNDSLINISVWIFLLGIFFIIVGILQHLIRWIFKAVRRIFQPVN